MNKINLYLWITLSFIIIGSTLWVLSNRPSLRNKLREILSPVSLQLKTKNVQVGKLLAHATLNKSPSTNPELWFKNEFVEKTKYGPLPKKNIANEPVYLAYNSSKVKLSGKSSLTVLVVNLGFDTLSHGWAVSLPSEVTLSYSPYADNLQSLLSLARGLDHEVFIDLPMSSPNNKTEIIDSGPLALSFRKSKLLKNSLYNVFSKSTGYIGLYGGVAEFINSQPKNVARILGEFENRGLLYIDRNAKSISLIINSFGKSEYRPVAKLIIDSTLASPEQLKKTHSFIVNSLQNKNKSAIWIVPSQQLSLIVLSDLLSNVKNSNYTLISFSQLAKLQK